MPVRSRFPVRLVARAASSIADGAEFDQTGRQTRRSALADGREPATPPPSPCQGTQAPKRPGENVTTRKALVRCRMAPIRAWRAPVVLRNLGPEWKAALARMARRVGAFAHAFVSSSPKVTRPKWGSCFQPRLGAVEPSYLGRHQRPSGGSLPNADQHEGREQFVARARVRYPEMR